jgi:hypothetical protein
MTASDRIRARLRDEIEALNLSQDDVAERMTRITGEEWRQGDVWKMLSAKGNVHLRVNEVDAMARALGLTLTEVVRDPGLEFYAEMTPSELRLFQVLRRNPSWLDAVLQLILGLRRPQGDELVTVKPKPKIGRPLDSSTTKAQKETWPETKPGKGGTAYENKMRKVSKTAQHDKPKKP